MNSNPPIKLRGLKKIPYILGASASTKALLRYSSIFSPVHLFRHRSLYSLKYRSPPSPLEKRGKRGRIPNQTQGPTRVCLHRIAHGKTGIEGCRDIAVGVLQCTAACCTVSQPTAPYSNCCSVPVLKPPTLLSPSNSVSLFSALPTTPSPPLSPHPQFGSQTFQRTTARQTSCPGHGRVAQNPVASSPDYLSIDASFCDSPPSKTE